MWRHLCLVLALFGSAVAPFHARAAPPQRVVSINLCADQLTVLLAHPGALVSVTHLSSVPSQSYVADRIGDLKINRGRAEEILAMEPDLVVAGLHAARPAVAMLKRFGVEVIDLPIPESFAAIREQTRLLAHRLGVEERGEALIADMDRRLAKATVDVDQRRRAFVLGTNGFTSGAGTLVDEVLQAAGLTNIASDDLGIVGFGRVGLEDIVATRPDLVVVNQPNAGSPSLARDFLRHPAIRSLSDRLVAINPNLWTCGGPYTAQAVEYLSGYAR